MNLKNGLILGLTTVILAGCGGSYKKNSKDNMTDENAQYRGPVPGSAEDFSANLKDRVNFDFDKTSLSADARELLDRQAEWLATYPSVDLLIEGHCDIRGTREYNLGLGERRAESVRKYLESKGVDRKRLHIVSYGKERLIAEGDTEEVHARNRVGISVIQ